MKNFAVFVLLPMLNDACVRSAAPGVAPTLNSDGKRIFQMIGHERCGYRQWFSFDEFPIGLTLWVGRDGGEFTLSRRTISGSHHGGKVTRRTQPDQINAAAVFGESFRLMDEWRFDLTLEQADAIAADLSAGKLRTVYLTEPAGKEFVLNFGGGHAKPSAAMLTVCRDISLN